MMKKQKQRSENGARKTDRTSIILSMFREFPNNKFSLKHLASASGGATKEGRRETLEILGRLFEEGVVEECAREKYRLMQTHLPHYEGVADMAPLGFGLCEGRRAGERYLRQQRNAANALNGDRVEVVVMATGGPQRTAGRADHAYHRTQPKRPSGLAEGRGTTSTFSDGPDYAPPMPMDYLSLERVTYSDGSDGRPVEGRWCALADVAGPGR